MQDSHHERADARMLGRAVSGERWPIPAEARDAITKKLCELAKGTGRSAQQAARTLARMDALNQADEHADRAYERIDEGKATERVDVIAVRNDIV